MNRTIPWRRFAAEGLVIVASILLAFGIDAWWAEQQDRREGALVLQALETEFRQNLEALSAVHEVHLRYEEGLAELSARVMAASEGTTLDLPESVLRPLVVFRTADPATGTLNTLLASGRIDLIEAPALQQALAAWPAVLEDVAEDERLVRDMVHRHLVADIAGELDVGRLLSATRSGSETGDGLFYELSVSANSRALIGQRHHLARLVVRQSRQRLEACEALLQLIDDASEAN